MRAEVFTHLLHLPKTAGGKEGGRGSSSCLTFWGWGDLTHRGKQPHLQIRALCCQSVSEQEGDLGKGFSMGQMWTVTPAAASKEELGEPNNSWRSRWLLPLTNSTPSEGLPLSGMELGEDRAGPHSL